MFVLVRNQVMNLEFQSPNEDGGEERMKMIVSNLAWSVRFLEDFRLL